MTKCILSSKPCVALSVTVPERRSASQDKYELLPYASIPANAEMQIRLMGEIPFFLIFLEPK